MYDRAAEPEENAELTGIGIIYFDDNPINRSLAAAILGEAGAVVACAPTLAALAVLIGRRRFDVAVIDLDAAADDPDGFRLTLHEPRFRELPVIAIGGGQEPAGDGRRRTAETASGIAGFAPIETLPAPLDSRRLIEAIRRARQAGRIGGSGEAIGRTALLARTGGNEAVAVELLDHFIGDYSGQAALIGEAMARADYERAGFLLRNLRAAAGAVGADALYRLAEEVQNEIDRGESGRLGGLAAALADAERSAARLREELGRSPLKAAAASPRPVQAEAPDRPAPTEGPILLVIDDSAANRKFIAACLTPEYRVLSAAGGAAGLELARAAPRPDLALLDVTMPDIDGYETCRLLKEDPRTRSIPVIFLTSLAREEDEERGFALGAVDYIRKPFSVPILKARIHTQLELARYRDYLETVVEERTRALKETQREVVFRLALAAEYRDNDTGSHIKRICYYSMTLAERIGFTRGEADLLYYASSMHDVGKIGIPDHILLKPGKLDPDEWKVMQTHTSIGAALLEGHPSELLRIAARIALSHHERWDGTGYPKGLAAENVPLEGRVVAVCDVFDALLSERPYKRAWSDTEALDEINRMAGRQFDPAIVRAFNDVFPEFLKIKERFKG